jgi:undecaprenyl diphosphate synthase
VRTLLQAALQHGIPYVTVYAFSSENWSRPPREVNGIMRLLRHYLRREIGWLMDKGIRLRTIGRTQELPDWVQPALAQALQTTCHNTKLHFTLALNYSARHEVVDAVAALLQARCRKEPEPQPAEAGPLDWATLSRHLYTHELPDPDLIIRTSGEQRLSNFLMLQSAYAELYFTPKPWPNFGAQDFLEALQSYAQRQRRFGQTGQQLAQDTPADPAPVRLAEATST